MRRKTGGGVDLASQIARCVQMPRRGRAVATRRTRRTLWRGWGTARGCCPRLGEVNGGRPGGEVGADALGAAIVDGPEPLT